MGYRCLVMVPAILFTGICGAGGKLKFDRHGACDPIVVVVDKQSMRTAVPTGLHRFLSGLLQKVPEGYKLEVDIGKVHDQSQNRTINFCRSIVPLNPAGNKDGVQDFRKPWDRVPYHIIPWKNGQRHGVEKAFDRTQIKVKGRLKSVVILTKEVPWRNGRIHGTKKLFGETGKLIFECAFVNGRQEGAAKSYAANGKVVSVTPYRDGKKEGKAMLYYPGTDKVKREVIYHNNKINGTTREYFKNGKLKRKMQIKDSRMHGVVELYDEKTGRLVRKAFYINGENVSEAEFKKQYKP